MNMLREFMPLSCVLVKPAGPDCNLRCDYCFYLEKKKFFPGKTRMKDQTLEMLIRQSLNGKKAFSFIWQGGEPTLMGLDFFGKVVELQKKYGPGVKVSNALQTNGTLLNEEWANFFKENNFLVGLSLDGDEKVHNRHRKNIGHKGTWDIVSKNARMLLDKGVAVNSISCVTEENAVFAASTYKYLRDLGFVYMQFIPIVEKTNNKTLAPFSIASKTYGRFLCELFDTWIADFQNDQPRTSIRTFDSIFFTLRGAQPPECGMFEICGKYLAVEYNGNVYPCDFFVEPGHYLGNVHEHDLNKIFNARKIRTFGGAKADLPKKCTKCEWKKLCQGGCLKDRRNNPRNFRENYFCKGMKIFYEHAVPTLSEMARNWRA